MSTHPLHTALGSLIFFLNVFPFVPLSVRPRSLPPLLPISATVPTLLFSGLFSYFLHQRIRPSTHSSFLATFLHFLSIFIVSAFTVFVSFFSFFLTILLHLALAPLSIPIYTLSPILFSPLFPILPSFLPKNIEIVCPSHIHLSFCLSSSPPSHLSPSIFYILSMVLIKKLLFSCFSISPLTSFFCFCFLLSFETYLTHSTIPFCQSFPFFPLLITGFPLILRQVQLACMIHPLSFTLSLFSLPSVWILHQLRWDLKGVQEAGGIFYNSIVL